MNIKKVLAGLVDPAFLCQIFRADRQLDYDKQTFYRGGYLFLQSVYYGLQLNKTCRKLKNKYKFKY
ncbi:MAG: hypothetical protein IJA36_07020, partial [Lachnospiraceae bacterium]|nr:hypothetical protein [Lachnospiraceae bacterium]